MKIHKIKLNEIYCDDVYNHIKTAELRVNDRDYQKGDYIVFTAVSKTDSRRRINHPINRRMFRISYLLSFDGLIGDGQLAYPWVMFCIIPIEAPGGYDR